MAKKINKIEKLIAELCPEGVEVNELQKLFVTKNGYTPSTTNKAYWTDGMVPWFRMEDIRENGRILSDSLQHITEEAVKGGRLFPANSIIIATSATIGEHALITVPHLSNQRFTSLTLKPEYENRLDMKFVFYYCFVLDEWCRKNITTSSFASVDMNGFKRFPIPIPPLVIQEEIVRILDTFTKLEAELEAELEARKKQYEYYRDELLTFGDDVEWKMLGEVGQLFRGTAITVKETTFGDIPVVANAPKQICFHNESNRSGETIVVARSGAYAGLVSFWSQPIFLTDAFSVSPDATMLKSKFVYYLLKQKQETIHAMKKGSGVPHVRVKDFESYSIPVPPLAEQERIVAILDKFDALVNDISVGLPAELNARRKQYEYYRDKLLTFKPLEEEYANQ